MSELISPCPILNLSSEELKQFQRTAPDEVAAFLATLNYGPSKILVDSFYLSPDKKTGVATLLVRKELCRDHFGILRGVDSVEAIAQAAIVHRWLRGELKDIKPLFGGINKASFKNISTVGAVLNIVVQDATDEEGKFASYGWVLRGNSVLTEGEIYGVVTDAKKNLQASLIKRANMLQKRERPLFGI
jgi:hypothetical protein